MIKFFVLNIQWIILYASISSLLPNIVDVLWTTRKVTMDHQWSMDQQLRTTVLGEGHSEQKP